MKAGTDNWAIVPVKRFADAKSRLAAVLGGSERHELARVMVEDVLDSLSRCGDVLTGTVVVTADPEAAAIGRSRGAVVVFEADDNGINAAVRLALASIDASDAGVLIVPSDVPQVSPAAIATAADAIARPRTLAIAAAEKDAGTNLLACRPAASVPLHFGPDSYVRHVRAAEQAGFAVCALQAPELLLDIDRPEDLPAFLALETRTRTHAFLSRVLPKLRPDDGFTAPRNPPTLSPQSSGHDL